MPATTQSTRGQRWVSLSSSGALSSCERVGSCRPLRADVWMPIDSSVCKYGLLAKMASDGAPSARTATSPAALPSAASRSTVWKRKLDSPASNTTKRKRSVPQHCVDTGGGNDDVAQTTSAPQGLLDMVVGPLPIGSSEWPAA